eukprot:2984128-Rhodomonas_salina.2
MKPARLCASSHPLDSRERRQQAEGRLTRSGESLEDEGELEEVDGQVPAVAGQVDRDLDQMQHAQVTDGW